MKETGKIKLSQRLRAVADTVITCKTVCDVGCDHGYVSITLVKEGKADKAIACDVNKGPLKQAQENILANNLSEVIETRLSDGLHNITKEDMTDAIVIAGMGGNLMADILEQGKEIVMKASQLVLQPQSELFLVRKKIREMGMHISSEKFLLDAGKYYWVMDVRPGKTLEDEDQDFFDKYSRYLLETKDSLYKAYLEERILINNSYINDADEEGKKTLSAKIEDLQHALFLINQA